MYLTEYQAKEILAQYGAPIPAGRVAHDAAEAEARCREIQAEKYAVKAQIRAGGRGLAGGVQFAATPSGVRKSAKDLIGRRLVTEQTGPRGEAVERVYVEEAVDLEQSLYVAFVIDQRTAAPTLLGSRHGGVDFEAKAAQDPSILKTLALPELGSLEGADVDGFLESIGAGGSALAGARKVVEAMVRVSVKTDASLIEINPLGVTSDGRVLAVDAKMVLDGNALPRHPELEALVTEGDVEEMELVARENEINFVSMEGDIGLVVNGAGLGLATHDMVIDAGGSPANFMDIRTTATSLQIAKGIGLLLGNPKVKVILVNIHGGGMTVCDTIAEAINFAYSHASRRPPIVYRAAGQNAPWALSIMKDRRLPFEQASTMTEAVQRAVAIAKSGTFGGRA